MACYDGFLQWQLYMCSVLISMWLHKKIGVDRMWCASLASSCFVSVMQADGFKDSPPLKIQRCLCKPHVAHHWQQSFPLCLETDTHFLCSSSYIFTTMFITVCVFTCLHEHHLLTGLNVCERVLLCFRCLWWLRLSLSCYWWYHWSCSNPFLCLCSTDLPVHTATVHAAAAVSQGLSSLRSDSLAQHTYAESAGHLLEDYSREEEQETDFKTEEGDELSDIMSARQMSIKDRSVYESVKYP